jgi:hypothetical protein
MRTEPLMMKTFTAIDSYSPHTYTVGVLFFNKKGIKKATLKCENQCLQYNPVGQVRGAVPPDILFKKPL